MIGRGGFLSMIMVMMAIPALMSTFDGLIMKEKALVDSIFGKGKKKKDKNKK